MRKYLDAYLAEARATNCRRHDAATLQERLEAASRRADQRASDMLSTLEDEFAACESDALENAFRARHAFVGSDEGW